MTLEVNSTRGGGNIPRHVHVQATPLTLVHFLCALLQSYPYLGELLFPASVLLLTVV